MKKTASDKTRSPAGGTAARDKQAILDRLSAHAGQHAYALSASAGQLVDAMLKRRGRNGGLLLCPCRAVDPAASPEEKQKIACPCVHAAAEIEAEGQCLCGMFLKAPPAASEPASQPARRRM